MRPDPGAARVLIQEAITKLKAALLLVKPKSMAACWLELAIHGADSASAWATR